MSNQYEDADWDGCDIHPVPYKLEPTQESFDFMEEHQPGTVSDPTAPGDDTGKGSNCGNEEI